MRILMWLTIGFGAACALCAYFLPVGWILPLILVFLLASGLGLCWKPLRRPATALLGCALGLVWFCGFYTIRLKPADRADGASFMLCASASDYSYETKYGSAVDACINLDGQDYQVRLYLDEKKTIFPGDTIEGTFQMKYTDPDEGKFSRYHQGNGVFLLGYQEGSVEVASGDEKGLTQNASVLRRKIQNILRKSFPEDVFPFVQALLLGDDSELDYETDTAFRISGIRHIIAVSGLHVSILFGLVSSLTFRKRYLTALIGIPCLLLFAAVAGFTPSVTRACIMVGLVLLAQLFQREYDSPTALSFAGLVMLIFNPLVITSVSFQLSMSSVAGIIMFREPICNWLRKPFGKIKGKSLKAKLIRWYTTCVSVSLSAMILTTPLCAIYFGTVSLIGVVTNLLTLWVVTFIFGGIMLTCLVGAVLPGVGGVLGAILAYPIRYVLLTAKLLSKVPLASVYTTSAYIAIWLVYVYILLLILLLQRKKEPGNMLAAGVVGLCLALILSWWEPTLYDTKMTVLDVGQGQSILLQSGDRTYLVDCGGDRDEDTADLVAETLLSQGIYHLDGIILTHMDADHAGGLSNLLTRVDTDLILLPAEASEDVENLRTRTGGLVQTVGENMILRFETGEIRIFASSGGDNSNENSLCILFDTEKCDILVTGDRSEFGEWLLMTSNELPKVDILIAGHHGSKHSTSQELLETVQPEIVMISAGKDNRYGHPAPELIKRLEDFGCTVYRTDENGTICYRR